MSAPTDRPILSATSANKSPKKSTSTDTTSFATEDPMASTTEQLVGENEQVKSMEYHRQVLKGKLEDDSAKNKYISPSDNIMSPCTQKLSALRGKQFGRAKPKSLFAQTANKNASAGTEESNPFATGSEKGGENGA